MKFCQGKRVKSVGGFHKETKRGFLRILGGLARTARRLFFLFAVLRALARQKSEEIRDIRASSSLYRFYVFILRRDLVNYALED